MRFEFFRRGLKKAAVMMLVILFCILLLPFYILSAGLRILRTFVKGGHIL